jgi:hypothetical protein
MGRLVALTGNGKRGTREARFLKQSVLAVRIAEGPGLARAPFAVAC